MKYRRFNSALFSFAIVILITPPAFSQETSSPAEIASILACQSETDDTARLQCFDVAASELKGATSSGELVSFTRDEVQAVEREAFGFNLPSLPRLSGIFGSGSKDKGTRTGDSSSISKQGFKAANPDGLKEVTLVVDRVVKTNRGRYRFYLENDQVWYQTDSEKILRPRKNDDGQITVDIRKGSFGGFFLQVNGKGRAIRVRRSE